MGSRNILFLLILELLITTGCSSLPSGGTIPAIESRGPAAPKGNADALFYALSSLDIDYRRGGSSRASGLDCSGLVAMVFREAYGMQLPRRSFEQSLVGVQVARDRLQAGDLVFFNTEREPFSHVGIYIGERRFVHAPRPGAAVRVENMQMPYWSSRFDGGRRILGAAE